LAASGALAALSSAFGASAVGASAFSAFFSTGLASSGLAASADLESLEAATESFASSASYLRPSTFLESSSIFLLLSRCSSIGPPKVLDSLWTLSEC